jgi:hypothetical protein
MAYHYLIEFKIYEEHMKEKKWHKMRTSKKTPKYMQVHVDWELFSDGDVSSFMIILSLCGQLGLEKLFDLLWIVGNVAYT